MASYSSAATMMDGLVESMRQYEEDPDAWWARINPELAAWRCDSRFIYAKHPFFFVTFLHPPEVLNEIFAARREEIRGRFAAGRPDRALVYYEKPYKLDALAHTWCSRDVPTVLPYGTGLAHRTPWPGMTVEQLRECLEEAWVLTEFLGFSSRSMVLSLFRAAGWTTDLLDLEGKPVPRPQTSQVLYRGCRRKRDGRGMSWTSDPIKARWFAKRLLRRKGQPGYVFRTTVKPDALLARFVGRGEAEYVLDTGKRWKAELIEELPPE